MRATGRTATRRAGRRGFRRGAAAARAARPGGSSMKYSTSVPSGRATVAPLDRSELDLGHEVVVEVGQLHRSAPAVVVAYSSLGRSGHEPVNATSRRPGRAATPSMTRSPPTTSRLRRSPTRARCSVDRAVVGHEHQELAVARPADRGGQAREQDDRSIEVRREQSRARALPSAATTNTWLSASQASVTWPANAIDLPVGGEHRERERGPCRSSGAGAGRRQRAAPTRRCGTGGRCGGASVGHEHDRGAVRRERGIVRGRNPRGSAAWPIRPATSTTNRWRRPSCQPTPSRRAASPRTTRGALRSRGARLRAIGHSDAAHDDDPRRVRRPRELADRTRQVAEPRRHAAVERREAHVGVAGAFVGRSRCTRASGRPATSVGSCPPAPR